MTKRMIIMELLLLLPTMHIYEPPPRGMELTKDRLFTWQHHQPDHSDGEICNPALSEGVGRVKGISTLPCTQRICQATKSAVALAIRNIAYLCLWDELKHFVFNIVHMISVIYCNALLCAILTDGSHERERERGGRSPSCANVHLTVRSSCQWRSYLQGF